MKILAITLSIITLLFYSLVYFASKQFDLMTRKIRKIVNVILH